MHLLHTLCDFVIRNLLVLLELLRMNILGSHHFILLIMILNICLLKLWLLKILLSIGIIQLRISEVWWFLFCLNIVYIFLWAHINSSLLIILAY